MKTKLGSVKKLEGLSYNNYEGLLKKTLPSLDGETEPLDYILIAGEQLDWKEQPKSEEQPLFYVGNTKDWVKWIKGSKTITLKDYCYGTCQITLEGDKANVQLLPEKGQLAKPQTLKPLAKVFKRMKPKVFFEVVEGWPEATSQVTAEAGSEDASTAAALELAKTFLTQHKQFTALQQQFEKSEAAGEGAQVIRLAADRRGLLSSLRQTTGQWKTDVMDADLEYSSNPALQQGQKLYDHWDAKLNKRPASKKAAPQSSTDPLAEKRKAFEAEELNYYENVLRNFEQYINDFDGDQTPDDINQNLLKYAANINTWRAASRKAGLPPSETLTNFTEEYRKALDAWKGMQPFYTDWWDKKTALEQTYTKEGYAALIAANEKIQEYAKTL